MEPITSQPTNEIGFGGENKTEGHVNGKKFYLQFVIINATHNISITLLKNVCVIYRFAYAIQCFRG